MTFNKMDCIDYIAKWLAKSLKGPNSYLPHVKIVSLRVAKKFISYIDDGYVTNIQDLIDIEIQKLKANADKVTEEARKASNENTLGLRDDILSELHIADEQSKIDERKTNSEVAKMDAETRRIEAETRRIRAAAESEARVTEADARLIKAISHLKQYGGNVIAKRDNLDDMINFNQESDPDIPSIEEDEKPEEDIDETS